MVWDFAYHPRFDVIDAAVDVLQRPASISWVARLASRGRGGLPQQKSRSAIGGSPRSSSRSFLNTTWVKPAALRRCHSSLPIRLGEPLSEKSPT